MSRNDSNETRVTSPTAGWHHIDEWPFRERDGPTPMNALPKPEPSERRRVQRLHMLEPLPGKIRGRSVHVLDVSVRGILVAHGEALGHVGDECELSFEWGGRPVVLDCWIRRSAVQRVGSASYARTLYHSGLEIRPSGRSMDVLRELIEAQVERALEEQKTKPRNNSRTAAPSERIELVRHEFDQGIWCSEVTTDPDQPRNGFTVTATHSATAVQVLRKSYATGDETAREAIRRIAALTISTAEAHAR